MCPVEDHRVYFQAVNALLVIAKFETKVQGLQAVVCKTNEEVRESGSGDDLECMHQYQASISFWILSNGRSYLDLGGGNRHYQSKLDADMQIIRHHLIS